MPTVIHRYTYFVSNQLLISIKNKVFNVRCTNIVRQTVWTDGSARYYEETSGRPRPGWKYAVDIKSAVKKQKQIVFRATLNRLLLSFAVPAVKPV